jgi:hypothetical protein
LIPVLLVSSCANSSIAPTPAEILADGFVSDSEYLAAIEAVGSCVEQSGADFSIEFDRNNTPSYRAMGHPDVDRIMDACIARYLGRVEFVWADQQAPTAVEEAAFYDAVVSCVEEQLGVEFGTVVAKNSARGPDTSVTDAALAADRELYMACLDRQLARAGG